MRGHNYAKLIMMVIHRRQGTPTHTPIPTSYVGNPFKNESLIDLPMVSHRSKAPPSSLAQSAAQITTLPPLSLLFLSFFFFLFSYVFFCYLYLPDDRLDYEKLRACAPGFSGAAQLSGPVGAIKPLHHHHHHPPKLEVEAMDAPASNTAFK